MSSLVQLDLFDDVLSSYAHAGCLTNSALYETLQAKGRGNSQEWNAREAIGKDGALHSTLKRSVRWYQQTLKGLQLLERVGRGEWRLTGKGKQKLTIAEPRQVMLGFSTDLGIALWARSESVFPSLGEPIHLAFTSLPYPLRRPRDYGGPTEAEFVDWTCRLLEPIIKNLDRAGSLVLNLSNDIFLERSPARSLYRERLVIALAEQFGLSKMDMLVWANPARPPGPMQWASRTRQQLNAGWEPLYWFAPNPQLVKANNRRVLRPHSEKQLALMAAGGERRSTSYGDGAHKVRPGSYANPTAGAIPKNVLTMSHNCPDKNATAALARAAGLPVHGATFPLRLAQFVIEFLTEKGDLMVDCCAGWGTSALAAELAGVRWMTTEQAREYVEGQALRFRQCAGFRDHLGLTL